ncbi:MAG: GNAT family N-acetyltransferase, partial [Lacticaseibacillus paracasei]|nr:GNAT family N-acetyltransferase [Lacticaseibacillus paracasei]
PRAKKLYERNGFLKHGALMIGSHRYDHLLRPVVGEEV